MIFRSKLWQSALYCPKGEACLIQSVTLDGSESGWLSALAALEKHPSLTALLPLAIESEQAVINRYLYSHLCLALTLYLARACLYQVQAQAGPD